MLASIAADRPSKRPNELGLMPLRRPMDKKRDEGF